MGEDTFYKNQENLVNVFNSWYFIIPVLLFFDFFFNWEWEKCKDHRNLFNFTYFWHCEFSSCILKIICSYNRACLRSRFLIKFWTLFFNSFCIAIACEMLGLDFLVSYETRSFSYSSHFWYPMRYKVFLIHPTFWYPMRYKVFLV